MANSNAKLSTGAKTSLGLAALAAAAAGAYYFYGSKNAAKHRKNLKSWMVKAKGEVMEKMENLKDLTKENYEKAVNQVMDKYKKMKNVDATELATLASELKGHWNRISSSIKESPAPRRPARKAGKK